MIDHLACSRCEKLRSADELANVCPCGAPLLARYDLEEIRERGGSQRGGRTNDVWRYREVMPIGDGEEALTLGEACTPLTPSRRIGVSLGIDRLYFKDEGINPTGSFKARGLAVAVHRARALGASEVALPSAGNAGSAAAAYAAAAGVRCTVAMPLTTPEPIVEECRSFGARLELVDGSIADAGTWIRERSAERGWFDVSTLREPYRIEGKKTMGYELAETLGWTLPDVIVYPTGGGTGLIAMWKAFEEMETLGWIGSDRPRMVVVQASGCAPIVTAHKLGREAAEPVSHPATLASGLRVPAALGDFLILAAVRASGGTAVAVDDDALLSGARRLARDEGIHAGPEAGATVAALSTLIAEKHIDPTDRVVCFVTGHGLKYPVIMGGE